MPDNKSRRQPSRGSKPLTLSGGRGPGLLGWAAATVVVVAVVAAIAVGIAAAHKHHSSAGLDQPPIATAHGRVTLPPWPVPDNAAAAISAAGLSTITMEGEAEHIHAHLDIIVGGQPVTVPANIGIDTQAGAMSPLHTHDSSGVLHIESPIRRPYNLAELFTEWDVSLSADNIGGLHAAAGKTLSVYVNGQLRQGDPATITFADHDEVALIYGGADHPVPAPTRYDFPAGL